MTSDEYKKFLNDLKPGDTVTRVLQSKFAMRNSIQNLVIVRRTETQIIAGSTASGLESRYYADDGLMLGSRARGRIYPTDAPEVAEAHTENDLLDIARHLDGIVWSTLPLESLQQILEILRGSK